MFASKFLKCSGLMNLSSDINWNNDLQYDVKLGLCSR